MNRREALTARILARAARIRRRGSINTDCEDRDERWRNLLHEITAWTNAATPYCYLRFGDGEFNSICGRRRRNSDGCRLFSDTLGRELHGVLADVADLRDKPDELRVGGWWDGRFAGYITEHSLLERIPWCSAGAFYNGMCTLDTKTFLLALKEHRGQKALIGNIEIAVAARFLNSEFIEVPAVDAWLRYAEIFASCLSQLRDGCLFIYCAGMMSNVLAFRLWQQNRRTTHVNLGHVFAACLGSRCRRYLQVRPGRVMINRHYAPLFRELQSCPTST